MFVYEVYLEILIGRDVKGECTILSLVTNLQDKATKGVHNEIRFLRQRDGDIKTRRS